MNDKCTILELWRYACCIYRHALQNRQVPTCFTSRPHSPQARLFKINRHLRSLEHNNSSCQSNNWLGDEKLCWNPLGMIGHIMNFFWNISNIFRTKVRSNSRKSAPQCGLTVVSPEKRGFRLPTWLGQKPTLSCLAHGAMELCFLEIQISFWWDQLDGSSEAYSFLLKCVLPTASTGSPRSKWGYVSFPTYFCNSWHNKKQLAWKEQKCLTWSIGTFTFEVLWSSTTFLLHSNYSDTTTSRSFLPNLSISHAAEHCGCRESFDRGT